MIRRFLFIILAMTAVAAGTIRDGFVIRGAIEGLDSGKVYLSYEYEHTKIIDSAIVSKGVFVFSGHVPEPVICTLKIAGGLQQVSFFVENVQMSLKTKRQSFFNTEVSGSQEHNIWMEYRESSTKALAEKNAAYRQLKNALAERTAVPADSSRMLEQALTMLKQATDSVTSEYVLLHRQYMAAAVIIVDKYIAYPDYEKAGKLYNVLSDSIKTSSYGRKMKYLIDAIDRTAIGQPAPDFTSKDSSGRKIVLSQLRGNYILVDFWASWCAPCRKENPYLLKAYKRFKKKGFEIIGVSLEKDRKAWLNAIQQDGLPWYQVSDLEGFDNSTAEMYGIKSIPKNFLLDRSGKIIAKNLRGNALEEKLAQLLP
jgi:peroxiredoxin